MQSGPGAAKHVLLARAQSPQNSGLLHAQVTVSSYAASLQQADTTLPGGTQAQLTEQQWRVLRFETEDKASQQSLAKVSLPGRSQPLRMLADCLGFEYTKSLAASGGWMCCSASAGVQDGVRAAACTETGLCCAVAALVGLHPGLQPALQPGAELKALLVGLGGGSLALYLAAHFPGLQLTVAELDPVVARAAVDAMGFPIDRCGLVGSVVL